MSKLLVQGELRSWLQHSLAFAWSTAWVSTGAVFAIWKWLQPSQYCISQDTSKQHFLVLQQQVGSEATSHLLYIDLNCYGGGKFCGNITRSDIPVLCLRLLVQSLKNADPLKGSSCLGETLRKVCGTLDDFEDGVMRTSEFPSRAQEQCIAWYWLTSLTHQMMK